MKGGFAPATWQDLAKGDRSVYEMEVITRAIEAFVMIDQVNAGSPDGMEMAEERGPTSRWPSTWRTSSRTKPPLQRRAARQRRRWLTRKKVAGQTLKRGRLAEPPLEQDGLGSASADSAWLSVFHRRRSSTWLSAGRFCGSLFASWIRTFGGEIYYP